MTDPNPYKTNVTPETSEQQASRSTWKAFSSIPSGMMLCLFSGWYRMKMVGVVTLAAGTPQRETQVFYELSADFMLYLGVTVVVLGGGYLAFLPTRKKFRG